MGNNIFEGVITVCILAGIVIGFVLFVALPWAWHLIKPFIHLITA